MQRMRFTDELWASIADVYKAIRDHPFVEGLRDGGLDREAFRFYVVQDAHYLREYARALSVLAARAPDEAAIAMFDQHAAGAIEVETQLHETFFRDFGLSAEAVASTPMAPTNLAYCSYLLATVYGGSFAEGIAAVLPCYWIYWEVGKELAEAGSSDPLYQRWIDTYAAEQFASLVRAVLDLTDRVAEQAGQADRERMRGHFRTTSRYEWMFWDMGYRREAWPV